MLGILNKLGLRCLHFCAIRMCCLEFRALRRVSPRSLWDSRLRRLRFQCESGLGLPRFWRIRTSMSRCLCKSGLRLLRFLCTQNLGFTCGKTFVWESNSKILWYSIFLLPFLFIVEGNFAWNEMKGWFLSSSPPPLPSLLFFLMLGNFLWNEATRFLFYFSFLWDARGLSF